jgi:hypothetical protein
VIGSPVARRRRVPARGCCSPLAFLVIGLWLAAALAQVPRPSRSRSRRPSAASHPLDGPASDLKPYTGALLAWERRGDEDRLGGEVLAGVCRDLANPNLGLLAGVGEGYARGIDGLKPDGGFRLGGAIPFFALQLGADYSLRNDELDFIFSLKPSLRRGGPFHRGDHLRIDWYPGRHHSLSVGFVTPLGQPFMGKTRPKSDHVRLPKASTPPAAAFTPDAELTGTLDRVRHAADWINRYTTPFFDQSGSTDESHIAEFEATLATFEDHLRLADGDHAGGHTYTAEIAAIIAS